MILKLHSASDRNANPGTRVASHPTTKSPDDFQNVPGRGVGRELEDSLSLWTLSYRTLYHPSLAIGSSAYRGRMLGVTSVIKAQGLLAKCAQRVCILENI